MSAEENLANAIRDFLLSETMLGQSYETSCSARFGLGSPIEKILNDAVVYGSLVGISWFEITRMEPEDNCSLKVSMQEVVIDWPVDFLFTVKSDYGPISKLVVECDGHDFHERTKEQAARDRSRDRNLQANGYAVFRFTGSEIYRDAFGCARQIFKWAEEAAWKKGE